MSVCIEFSCTHYHMATGQRRKIFLRICQYRNKDTSSFGILKTKILRHISINPRWQQDAFLIPRVACLNSFASRLMRRRTVTTKATHRAQQLCSLLQKREIFLSKVRGSIK